LNKKIDTSEEYEIKEGSRNGYSRRLQTTKACKKLMDKEQKASKETHVPENKKIN